MAKIIGTSLRAGTRNLDDRMIVPDPAQDWHFRQAPAPAAPAAAPARADAQGPAGPQEIGALDATGRNVVTLSTLPLADGFFIQGDTTENRAGTSVSNAGDFNNDGFDDYLVTAPQGGGATRGEAYLLFGRAGGFTDIDLSTLSPADGIVLRGSNASRLSQASSAGDVNGDGFDDIVLGASYGGGSFRGETIVIFGRAASFGTTDGAGRKVFTVTGITAADGFIVNGDAVNDGAGFSVSKAGDVNNDGYDDIVIGAQAGDDGGTSAGEAYLIFGKATGFGTISLTTLSAAAGFVIQGDAAGDQLGYSVSGGGDINNDGYDDFIVGAIRGDNGGTDAGEAYVIFGKAGTFGTPDGASRQVLDLTSFTLADGFIIQGDAAGDIAGGRVASAGDINNDGFDDIIVGAPGGDDGGDIAGEAYVIFGKASGFTNIDLTTLAPAAGFVIQGDQNFDVLGRAVAAAGDVNGDGFDDIIVGSVRAGGAAYLIYGSTTGFGYLDEATGRQLIDTTNLAVSEGFIIQGVSGDNVAFSVSGAGDINNDGYDDLVVGAESADSGASNAGGAYVIFGKAYAITPNVATPGIDHLIGTSGDDVINALGGNDRIDGLGGNDEIDGGAGADTMIGRAGDDIYYIDDSGDVVVEANGAGSDTIRTSIDFGLAAGLEIETLEVRNAASTNAVNITGNALNQHITGNAGDNNLNGGGGTDVLTGLGGNDIYFAVGPEDTVVEAAGQGFDQVYAVDNYTLAAGVSAEVLVSRGTITGNEFSQQIFADINGGPQNDTLNGGGGADTLIGGQGDDTYMVEQDDAIVESASEGFDQLISNGSYILAAGVSIEKMTAANNGAAAVLIGNALVQEIVGNDVANVLDGGGGADTLRGGKGDDSYAADADDIIVEVAGEGYDQVLAHSDYTLGNSVDIEALSAYSFATTENYTLIGNSLNNQVFGNAGANFLSGGGGADALYGNGGNDTFSVDNDDAVLEGVGGGFDVVYSSANYALSAGAEIEVLSGNDANATTPLNLAGNEYGQQIIGNAGDNFLIAGAGADALYGGLGNDTYSVDTLDVVFDTGGNDIIYSSTNFQLNAGAAIEILSANDFAATTALNLAGNELDQQIFGNAGNNFLIAGAGADGLYGKGGNDTYSVDSQDVVVEATGEGYDTVYTSTSFALGAGSEIEVLSVNDFAATSGLLLTGNEFGQQILGNSGANTLDGKAGADTMIGGAGADVFNFTTALGGGNVDAISDFQGGLDKIGLENAVFTGLAGGNLAAGAFVTGSAAADTDDRIIYNSATGALLFDADGTGAIAAVQFATVATGLNLAASDFIVI